MVTLLAFIAGSVLGAAHLPWWQRWPSLPPVDLVGRLGWPGALATTLALCGLVAAATLLVERRRQGVAQAAPVSSPRAPSAPPSAARGWRRVVEGPWPLLAGAVGLALVNCATLALAGRPWGITSAFALWGSKLLATLGVDVASWPYWAPPSRAAELRASVLNDVPSVMNFGILLGALLAAGLAGRFRPSWRIPPRSLGAAILGGLLLGYGARLASGCNIGAFFGGTASGSLHGWVWFVAAIGGGIVGVQLRPWFGLPVERPQQTGPRAPRAGSC
jgi:uncharacterized membrane protein YedE/YeeE